MIGTVLRPWLKNFINLIYPLSCLICKVSLAPLSDRPLCTICWDKIEYNLAPFCRVCGKHLPSDLSSVARRAQEDGSTKSQTQALICQGCQKASYFFTQAYAVCIYDGIIEECIHLFKYKNKLSLAKPLSKLMIDFAHNFLDVKELDVILPVPLHKTKQRQRQFNQAEALARPLAKAFFKPLASGSLTKIKPGLAQVNLSRTARLKNVRDCFKVKNTKTIINKNILLVDDVLTTLATANECARMLLEAGANRIDVFALARGV